MRFRRVTLLVVLYLLLDFANPMMPGAVQLVAGSLQAVAGCPARGAEGSVLAIAIAPCDPSFDLPQSEPAPRARLRAVSASPGRVVFRTPTESRSTPPSSLDDD